MYALTLTCSRVDPNEDICELWNEDESELSQDLKDQDEEEPQLESEIQIETIQGQSRALAIWLHQFMLCIQAVFHISDNALSFCIRFFKGFFSVLGRFCKVSAEIAECLPSSLYAAKVGINQPKFRKYVVCKKCHIALRVHGWHVRADYALLNHFPIIVRNECGDHVELFY